MTSRLPLVVAVARCLVILKFLSPCFSFDYCFSSRPADHFFLYWFLSIYSLHRPFIVDSALLSKQHSVPLPTPYLSAYLYLMPQSMPHHTLKSCRKFISLIFASGIGVISIQMHSSVTNTEDDSWAFITTNCRWWHLFNGPDDILVMAVVIPFSAMHSQLTYCQQYCE